MAIANRHKAWLTFVRKATDVPINYSIADLNAFLRLAQRENPAMVKLIEGYLDLATASETDAGLPEIDRSNKRTKVSKAHLFDLLREKKFFPRNSNLAQFAARVLPGMRAYSFEKMARSDIAARIVEYVEESDPRKRVALEQSMRTALTSMQNEPPKSTERKNFLSKWERIIKGLEL